MKDRPNHYLEALKMIPGDYLHLIPGETKLSALSEEQLNQIIIMCLEIGLIDEQIINVIRNFEFMISGGLLARSFFEGRIKFMVDMNGELYFLPKQTDETNNE